MLGGKYPHMYGGDVPRFRRYIYHWMEKAGFVVRRVTHNANHDESGIWAEVFYAASAFRALREEEDEEVPLRLCVNMDQTSMDLREASTTTIDERGASHVSVRAVKSAPKRVTLLLAVAFDGTYLPPMIVFTGKPGGAVERELAAMDGPNLHAVQDKGWTDQVIMNRWISEVLGHFLASRRLGYTGPAIDMYDK